MKETLAGRVQRLVTGSVAAIVDAMENAAPAVVMEQAIAEMDGAIADIRSELGAVLANGHLAGTRLEQARGKHADLADRIQVAVTDDRDDLAEAAIAQQLDIEAQLPVLEQTIRDGEQRRRELEGYLAAVQAKKREMVEEVQEFRRATATASTGGGAGTGRTGESRQQAIDSTVDRAEAAFDRVLARAAGMPAAAGVADRESAAQLAELEHLSRTHRIRERLAAAKAQTRTSG